MAITTALVIDGTLVTDAINIRVTKAIGENSATGSFSVDLPNRNGENKNKFQVGDEVTVYADSSGNAFENLFDITFDITFGSAVKIGVFVLEDINFTGQGENEIMTLRGRDYGAVLQDVTIEPTVYTNQEISLIVKDIIANELPGVSTTNVDVTSVTLTRKRYNHTNVYDAIKELAELADYYMYIDNNKGLNFKSKNTISSGVTLNNTNVTAAQFTVSEQGMVNSIWVYGDRQLFQVPRESFTGDGAGSVFTLNYKPHNTLVGVSGTSKIGGVFQNINTPTSGVQYLVDYENKKIIFVSGTDAGNNVPGSLVNITVDYSRTTPIVKFGEDDGSIQAHGRKEEVIIDRNIQDPTTATDIATKTLALKSLPLTQGNINVHGTMNLNAGDTILVNLPYHNISNQTYTILEVNYEFNIRNNLSEDVLSVKVADKINTMVDTIKKIILDLRKLQATDAEEADVITRLKSATGSMGFKVKSWSLSTNTLGSSFVIQNPTLGKIGSSLSPQPYIGDSRGAFAVVVSGGEA